MKLPKLGETKPCINKDQAFLIHNETHKCSNPYLVIKPLSRFEKDSFFNRKFYSEECWECLACKWESEVMVTRTS